jgi:hypothetical protein
MFVASDTQCLSCVMFGLRVIHVCMNAYYVCVVVYFPAIESNDDCAEEGEVFEYKRKEIRDNPTKASHLFVAYLNPNTSHCMFILLLYIYA